MRQRRIKRYQQCLFIIVLHLIASAGITWNTSLSQSVASTEASTSNLQQPPPIPAQRLEGCVTCHGQIEPMHKYGSTGTLEKLNGDKGAVLLTCTACHGGNPVPRKTSDNSTDLERIKNEAHVRPRFPQEWKRDGKYTGANPERTNTLLARESWEFVRFINPGDLRVVDKTCTGSSCHNSQTQNV